MLWQFEPMENSFKFLNYILLFCIIALAMAQFILKLIQPLQLLVLLLVYVVLVWQRISSYTYRIIILVGLAFILRQCLTLINFCFGQQSDLISKQKISNIDQKTHNTIIIISACWILIMCYATLLCWRAYQRSKLYLMLTNQFVLN